FANVIMAMRRCPKFIVGCITGKVVGGGVGLASACDYAFADASASIRLSELSIGIGPFVIEPAITRKIGITAFSKMTMKPKEWKSHEWAKQKGIYKQFFEDAESCEKSVQEFAKDLSIYSLEAMRDLKSIFWKETEEWKSPEWAKEKGIYNQVFEAAESCEKSVQESAKDLSIYRLEAMRDLKSIFWNETEDWKDVMPKRAEMSGHLVLSDFTRETLMK